MNKLLIVSGPQLPPQWLDQLIADFASANVTLVTDQPDNDVRYALAWRPPHGRLAEFPNLQAVFSFGAGVDHIFEDKNLPQVPIIRAVTDDLAERMSEYVVWQVLHHHRRGQDYSALQQQSQWRPLGTPKAANRRVGILGYGRLGQHAGKALLNLGFQISGWSRSEKSPSGVSHFHGEAGLPKFLADTEILVCLLPLTDATRGILANSLFEQLPKGAALVHVGRGEHLNTADLLTALNNKHLSGASVDVTPEEPLPADNPLWAHPRIVITPHIASTTDGKALGAQIALALNDFERGVLPANIVDTLKGY
ncbi:MAG: 2-hydroxyacid dehydrogenase [Alphaproteobacteria bacterium]